MNSARLESQQLLVIFEKWQLVIFENYSQNTSIKELNRFFCSGNCLDYKLTFSATSRLREVNLRILPAGICRNAYPSLLSNSINDADFICAGQSASGIDDCYVSSQLKG